MLRWCRDPGIFHEYRQDDPGILDQLCIQVLELKSKVMIMLLVMLRHHNHINIKTTNNLILYTGRQSVGIFTYVVYNLFEGLQCTHLDKYIQDCD